MSYTVNQLVACPTLQDDLITSFRTCDTSKLRTPMPFFEYMMSPLNRGDLQTRIAPGNGKIRSVDLVYNQRFLESQVSSNVSHPTCTATDFAENNYTNYSIDTSVNDSIAFQFRLSDLVEACQSNQFYMAELVQRMMNALIEKVASRTAQSAVALAGKWGSDVSSAYTVTSDKLQVRTVRSSATDEVYPWTMQEIETALQLSGFCNGAAIFGGVNLHNYAQRMMAGCCADQGVDLSSIMSSFGKAVLYDRKVASAGSSLLNYNLAVMPGALQLVTYNLFEGANTIIDSGTLYSQRVVQDPETGFPADLMMKYDCGQFHIVMTATSKVFAMPNDLFQSGDIYNGVNFVTEIEVAN